MLTMGIGPYRKIYFGGILGKLDPQETWDNLHELGVHVREWQPPRSGQLDL